METGSNYAGDKWCTTVRLTTHQTDSEQPVNTYKYTPYYEFKGPEASNPLREQLSKDDQERNIELFYSDALNIFEDEEAVVSRDENGVVSIQSDLIEKVCDDRIKAILNSLDLYAKKS